MANCGYGPRSEPINRSIDRSKDIHCGAADKLRGLFQADPVVGRTVRELH